MKTCHHGFNPDTGPGLWCPSCDAEEQMPWWEKFMFRHPMGGIWLSTVGVALSLIAVVMSLGVVMRWW